MSDPSETPEEKRCIEQLEAAFQNLRASAHQLDEQLCRFETDRGAARFVESLEVAARKVLTSVQSIHRAFGAPGDYGYDSKKGKALYELYIADLELRVALDLAPVASLNLAKALRAEDESS